MNVIMSSSTDNTMNASRAPDNDATTCSSPDESTTASSPRDVRIAGRTNYGQWDKIATTLVNEVEEQDKEEAEIEKGKLGLDGKYAFSQAEADEREKLKKAKKTKKTLEKFKKRETQVIQALSGLLGPVYNKDDETTKPDDESKQSEQNIVRITRDMVDAGKRVVSICDTAGSSMTTDTIVLTHDLSNLESKMPTNALATPKSYADDAENDVPAQPTEEQQYRKILGLIKLFIANVHNCTIIIKCKIITGTVELHNCSNVKLQIESTATVATIQADLSSDIIIEFHDAPSSKNVPGQKPIYWGEDKDDRIFHAGIKNMKVSIYRDGYIENEVSCDYIKDGAEAIGNATAEEFQFVTSCMNGALVTEKVVRAGTATGTNVRAMTDRELAAEKERRERAAKVALKMADDMIQIRDKDGNKLVTKTEVKPVEPTPVDNNDEEIEEVYASMSKEQIDEIVAECEVLKKRGNEAFGAGEYGQAILHYSLTLDKASELPDDPTGGDSKKSLYARDIILSNRAACFLKLGQHEKAEIDAQKALQYNPDNVKANFRLGLALHAQNKYEQALPILVKAQKIEPTNKQIKQALQFCEVRMEMVRRKMMEK